MNRHGLLMLVCCLAPIALIVGIGAFGISLGSLSGIAPLALVLLCPLMMIFMMGGHKHGSEHAGHLPVQDEKTQPDIPATARTVTPAPALKSGTTPGSCH